MKKLINYVDEVIFRAGHGRVNIDTNSILFSEFKKREQGFLRDFIK